VLAARDRERFRLRFVSLTLQKYGSRLRRRRTLASVCEKLSVVDLTECDLLSKLNPTCPIEGNSSRTARAGGQRKGEALPRVSGNG